MSVSAMEKEVWSVATLPPRNMEGLPSELQVAQNAIHLSEVREMLRRLSAYNLGIYMPHMHDEETGQFQSLPDELIQVESGLQVSFRTEEEFASQAIQFVPVGWVWRAGASVEDDEAAKCVARCKKIGNEHDKIHLGK